MAIRFVDYFCFETRKASILNVCIKQFSDELLAIIAAYAKLNIKNYFSSVKESSTDSDLRWQEC
jgi:hypothetical protein